MRKGKRKLRRAAVAACAVLAITGITFTVLSCGGSKPAGSGNSVKLPPGVDSKESAGGSSQASGTASAPGSSGTGAQAQDNTTPATPNASADLVGGHFTVVGATRKTSNKSVLTSGGREVAGDYLEVEFKIQNTGTALIDLSQYSFRLLSPGIAADTYEDYYGENGTYGAYVDDNEISATLLSYSDLQPVTYKLKVGEEVPEVFAFFDLNPESTAKNANVTKDNAAIIIRKVSGTDYGKQVSIALTGYPD